MKNEPNKYQKNATRPQSKPGQSQSKGNEQNPKPMEPPGDPKENGKEWMKKDQRKNDESSKNRHN